MALSNHVVVDSERIQNQEFSVEGAFWTDRSGPARWVLSHLSRNKGFVASFIIFTMLTNVLTAAIPAMTGWVFDELLDGDATHDRLSDESTRVTSTLLSYGHGPDTAST